jgi:hypothetical protein
MTLDRAEALRYLAIARPDASSLEALEPVAAALEEALTPRFTFAAFPVRHTPEGEALEGSGLVLPGKMARTMLRECSDAVLLLCTLGAGFEARLRAASARDMAQAAMLDACGSAYVEAGCDGAEQAVAARFPGKFLTDRFSPGYGDLPLSLQPALCAALDSRRRLGVTVTESLLMLPVKSVSAVIGLADKPQPARIRGCGFCSRRETCEYRKGGTTCGAV